MLGTGYLPCFAREQRVCRELNNISICILCFLLNKLVRLHLVRLRQDLSQNAVPT